MEGPPESEGGMPATRPGTPPAAAPIDPMLRIGPLPHFMGKKDPPTNRHPDESQDPDHKAGFFQESPRPALRPGFRLSPE
ncbi:hypothetical protein GCM10017621_33470 [Maricaulis virginensis]|uniref:Uncharacterized protein n=1 Tax=Maricaulis virginensis TaxID=144022 RepID=A0A9W6IQS4_9PROT|nr:hypothetical protein GCM10017621_33470 [Maricaulis virginensis]